MTRRSGLPAAGGRRFEAPGTARAPQAWVDDDAWAPRRRRPAAVVGGALLMLAAGVLVAGGAFVLGFTALAVGAVLLLRPPRARKRTRPGLVRRATRRAGWLAWLGVVALADVLRWAGLQVRVFAPVVGRGLTTAARHAARALVGAARGTAAKARGSQRTAGRISARTTPVVAAGGRRGVMTLSAGVRRARTLAGAAGTRARAAAQSEAAHLGTVVLVPVRDASVGGNTRAASMLAGQTSTQEAAARTEEGVSRTEPIADAVAVDGGAGEGRIAARRAANAAASAPEPEPARRTRPGPHVRRAGARSEAVAAAPAEEAARGAAEEAPPPGDPADAVGRGGRTAGEDAGLDADARPATPDVDPSRPRRADARPDGEATQPRRADARPVGEAAQARGEAAGADREPARGENVRSVGEAPQTRGEDARSDGETAQVRSEDAQLDGEAASPDDKTARADGEAARTAPDGGGSPTRPRRRSKAQTSRSTSAQGPRTTAP